MSHLIVASTGSTTANSYVSLTDADSFMADRLYTESWDNLTPETKEAALIWATTLLDQSFEWKGEIRDLDQRLRWPRSGVVNRDGHWYDYDSIPEVLERATAELALELAKRDRVKEPKVLGQGLSSINLGGALSISVDPSQVINIVPHHVVTMLDHIGEFVAGRGARVVPMVRR